MVVRRSRKKRSRSPCRYGRKKSMQKGCKKRPGPRRSRIKKSRAKKNKPRLRSRVRRSRLKRSRVRRSRVKRSRVKRSRVKRSRMRRSIVKRSRKKRSRVRRSRKKRSRVRRSRKKRSRKKRSRVRRSRKKRSRVRRSRVKRSKPKKSRARRSRIRRSRKKRSIKKKYTYHMDPGNPPRTPPREGESGNKKQKTTHSSTPGKQKASTKASGSDEAEPSGSDEAEPFGRKLFAEEGEGSEEEKTFINNERNTFIYNIVNHLQLISEFSEIKFSTTQNQIHFYTNSIRNYINTYYDKDYLDILFDGFEYEQEINCNIIPNFTIEKQKITLHQICDIMNELQDEEGRRHSSGGRTLQSEGVGEEEGRYMEAEEGEGRYMEAEEGEDDISKKYEISRLRNLFVEIIRNDQDLLTDDEIKKKYDTIIQELVNTSVGRGEGGGGRERGGGR